MVAMKILAEIVAKLRSYEKVTALYLLVTGVLAALTRPEGWQAVLPFHTFFLA